MCFSHFPVAIGSKLKTKRHCSLSLFRVAIFIVSIDTMTSASSGGILDYGDNPVIRDDDAVYANDLI